MYMHTNLLQGALKSEYLFNVKHTDGGQTDLVVVHNHATGKHSVAEVCCLLHGIFCTLTCAHTLKAARRGCGPGYTCTTCANEGYLSKGGVERGQLCRCPCPCFPALPLCPVLSQQLTAAKHGRPSVAYRPVPLPPSPCTFTCALPCRQTWTPPPPALSEGDLQQAHTVFGSRIVAFAEQSMGTQVRRGPAGPQPCFVPHCSSCTGVSGWLVPPTLTPSPRGLFGGTTHLVTVYYAPVRTCAQVGNGDCWTLADAAFKAAGARRPMMHNYGQQIQLAQARPGDVMYFERCRFEG